jgi:hypothetical protein
VGLTLGGPLAPHRTLRSLGRGWEAHRGPRLGSVSTEKGITVQIVAVSRDQGEIVLFEAFTLDGRPCHVAVDQQTSLDIAARLVAGQEETTGNPCYVVVGSWQLRP